MTEIITLDLTAVAALSCAAMLIVSAVLPQMAFEPGQDGNKTQVDLMPRPICC